MLVIRVWTSMLLMLRDEWALANETLSSCYKFLVECVQAVQPKQFWSKIYPKSPDAQISQSSHIGKSSNQLLSLAFDSYSNLTARDLLLSPAGFQSISR